MLSVAGRVAFDGATTWATAVPLMRRARDALNILRSTIDDAMMKAREKKIHRCLDRGPSHIQKPGRDAVVEGLRPS